MTNSPQSPRLPDRKRDGIKKRVTNACYRCRQQKIRCSGNYPCDQCTKRNLPCSFEDKSQKIWVSRGFIDDLERQAGERTQSSSLQGHSRSGSTELNNNAPPNATDLSFAHTTVIPASTVENDLQANTAQHGHNLQEASQPWSPEQQPNTESGVATPTAQMTNPFSNHAPGYVTASDGRPLYLGTSSNWAFNRRVLNIAHERLTGQPVAADITTYYHKTYDLNWNDPKDKMMLDNTCLPSSDHAIYLINAVKFHCGQIFHLFDESTFMQQFQAFQAGISNPTTSQGLWYIHYLLILAFGKVFVARRRNSGRPPGAELFEKAMDILPNIVVLSANPVESIEILCCMALYLQCLDFRGPAHVVIGQALRIAMEDGMHTNMQDHRLDETFVQRARNVWWTIYILELQMSSLQGLPLILRDEDISASLPASAGSLQKSLALELNVKLSRILAHILTTVYGKEGRLNRKFITSTKAVLREIAQVTDDLQSSFPIPVDKTAGGVSRLAAHLHLLHHQCIILATRPLLFSFLKWGLDYPDQVQKVVATSNSARVLLQMCTESSQHIIAVLSALKDQDLLETFLPFDLEAAYVAGMIILLAPVVLHSFQQNQIPWLDLVFSIIEEIRSQGNLQAEARKAELQKLQQLFSQISASQSNQEQQGQPLDEPNAADAPGFAIPHELPLDFSLPRFDTGLGDDAAWGNALTADNLMMLADTLDLEGIDWITTTSSNFADYD